GDGGAPGAAGWLRRLSRRPPGRRPVCSRASGSPEPRLAPGAFKDGLELLGGEGFAEGDAPQYTWMVPFDPAGLFAQLGGRRAAAARLDRHLEKLNEGPRSPNAFLGNEPELGVPWLYDRLRQPRQTHRAVRRASR